MADGPFVHAFTPDVPPIRPWQRDLVEFLDRMEPGDQVRLVIGRRSCRLVIESRPLDTVSAESYPHE